MKLRVIASVALGLMLSFGLACTGGDEASEPTEEGAEDESGEEEGKSEAAATGGEEQTGAETEAEAEAPAAVPEEAATLPAPPEPAPAPVPAATNFQGEKVFRYVTAYALNVRAEPSRESRVVRHVKFGDKVEVVINGEWAQLGSGEFIAITRLSETPPEPKSWMKGGAQKGKNKAKKRAQ